jgi:hypothetical protein
MPLADKQWFAGLAALVDGRKCSEAHWLGNFVCSSSWTIQSRPSPFGQLQSKNDNQILFFLRFEGHSEAGLMWRRTSSRIEIELSGRDAQTMSFICYALSVCHRDYTRHSGRNIGRICH